MAYANILSVTKSRDNFYVFDKLEGNYAVEGNSDANNAIRQNKPQRPRKSNFFFTVVDADKKLLNVDFVKSSLLHWNTKNILANVLGMRPPLSFPHVLILVLF